MPVCICQFGAVQMFPTGLKLWGSWAFLVSLLRQAQESPPTKTEQTPLEHNYLLVSYLYLEISNLVIFFSNFFSNVWNAVSESELKVMCVLFLRSVLPAKLPDAWAWSMELLLHCRAETGSRSGWASMSPRLPQLAKHQARRGDVGTWGDTMDRKHRGPVQKIEDAQWKCVPILALKTTLKRDRVRWGLQPLPDLHFPHFYSCFSRTVVLNLSDATAL